MTNVDTVRLLIADTDTTNQLFTDSQIETFLALDAVDDDVYLAAAAALDVVAVSEVLISKVIKSQDLSTDGAKVAESLRAQADRYREQADGGVFEIVDFDPWAATAAAELAE